MGAFIIYRRPALPSIALLFIAACGTGSQGVGTTPPAPLSLAEMEAELTVGEQAVGALFQTDTPTEFVLAADFRRLRRDREQESEEHPAQLLVRGPRGDAVEIPIQVRTRGNFRLRQRTCPDLPPLRLNFPETQPLGTIFDSQDKLKLVTHCRNSDRSEQDLLEEYLVYRIYNQLTDVSFRVQLARITYLDTSGESDPVRRMGFLIEDDDALGVRLGGIMVDVTRSIPTDFVLDQISLMYVFQFMVGNVDWGTGVGHNVRVVNRNFEYLPIPYDFDWSGFVDAPYAAPNELTEGRHDSVRQRVYWGVCLPGIDYPGVFARFNEAKGAVFSLPWEEIGLTERNAESAVAYLEDFYEIIDDPVRAERAFTRECRIMGDNSPTS